MPEQFRETFLRNLMPHNKGYRAFAQLCSAIQKAVDLPAYREPSWQPTTESRSTASSPIFITGRFRTGSTLLWQCFLRMKGFTAYYEPLNERQWFDPSKRGEVVDTSHRGVDDYSTNYDGLADLSECFDPNWTFRRLAMGPNHNDKKLARYVSRLIEAATDRPVLQFNRVDFRTGFLKAKFPDAILVHLTRNPRDTWLSTLRGKENDQGWNLLTYESFSRFYLLEWYRDLALSFPKLLRPAEKTHPYEVHYLLHRLSTLFAARDCDAFIAYEDMEHDLIASMEAMMSGIGISDVKLDVLEGLLSPRKHRYDHGPNLELYQDIENRVETELQGRLGSDG